MTAVLRTSACAMIVACGGPAPGTPHDADPGAPDSASGAVAGEITVLDGGGLGHNWRAPVVFGGFPTDPPAWHQEVVAVGDCRVLAYEPAFCDPPCDGVCTAPNTCRPWPAYRSAGTLTIGGLAAPLSVTPSFDASYVTQGGLPDPLFDSDATVTLDAAGGEIGAFSLSTEAVRRIAIPAFDAAGLATMVDGADLPLSWPDADAASRVHVLVHAGGAPHGVPAASVLECDVADTGALTIPRAAIEAMPQLGTGCAKGRDCAKFGIMRYRRATTETDFGTVTLTVGAGINYPVVHD